MLICGYIYITVNGCIFNAVCYNNIGDNMKCDNYLCIYEENGVCTLDNIELDIMGQCRDCIYINVEEQQLLKLKMKTIKSVESD